MYSKTLTAKAPCYLHHATTNSHSLFSIGQHEQLLPDTYKMSLTTVAPCSLQQDTNSISPCYPKFLPVLYCRTLTAFLPVLYSRKLTAFLPVTHSFSLFCTAHHYEQSLPVLYNRALTAICPCYLQHVTMNSRSLFCSESHYEKSLPPCSYVQTESINTLITPIHLTWIYDKKCSTRLYNEGH